MTDGFYFSQGPTPCSAQPPLCSCDHPSGLAGRAGSVSSSLLPDQSPGRCPVLQDLPRTVCTERMNERMREKRRGCFLGGRGSISEGLGKQGCLGCLCGPCCGCQAGGCPAPGGGTVQNLLREAASGVENSEDAVDLQILRFPWAPDR